MAKKKVSERNLKTIFWGDAATSRYYEDEEGLHIVSTSLVGPYDSLMSLFLGRSTIGDVSGDTDDATQITPEQLSGLPGRPAGGPNMGEGDTLPWEDKLAKGPPINDAEQLQLPFDGQPQQPQQSQPISIPSAVPLGAVPHQPVAVSTASQGVAQQGPPIGVVESGPTMNQGPAPYFDPAIGSWVTPSSSTSLPPATPPIANPPVQQTIPPGTLQTMSGQHLPLAASTTAVIDSMQVPMQQPMQPMQQPMQPVQDMLQTYQDIPQMPQGMPQESQVIPQLPQDIQPPQPVVTQPYVPQSAPQSMPTGPQVAVETYAPHVMEQLAATKAQLLGYSRDQKIATLISAYPDSPPQTFRLLPDPQLNHVLESLVEDTVAALVSQGKL